jgi:hypothetical protein
MTSMFVTPYFGYSVVPLVPAAAINRVVTAQRNVNNLYNQLTYDITRLNNARPGTRQFRRFERQVVATENRLAAAENRLFNAVNTAARFGAFLPTYPGFTPGPFYYYAAAPVFLPRRPFAIIGPAFLGPFPGLIRPVQNAPAVTAFGGSYNRNWV